MQLMLKASRVSRFTTGDQALRRVAVLPRASSDASIFQSWPRP